MVPAGVRGTKIVTQTRDKEYDQREAEPTTRGGGRFGRGRFSRRKRVIDRGGAGTEIVREIMVCPKCAEKYAEEEAARQAAAAALVVESPPEMADAATE